MNKENFRSIVIQCLEDAAILGVDADTFSGDYLNQRLSALRDKIINFREELDDNIIKQQLEYAENIITDIQADKYEMRAEIKVLKTIIESLGRKNE